jgi:hypothetical protein
MVRRIPAQEAELVFGSLELVTLAAAYDSLAAKLKEVEGDLQIALLQRDAKLCSECPRSPVLAKALSQIEAMTKALKSQHEWSEKLAKRIRDAVYASEELKDPLAFNDLDEDFYNGIAASYEDDYLAALKEIP